MKIKVFSLFIFMIIIMQIEAGQQVPKIVIEDVPVLQQNSSQKWDFEGEDGQAKMFDDTDIFWRHVREEDGTNCGYHALKNVTLYLEALMSPPGFDSKILTGQLQDERMLWKFLALWVPEIYATRKEEIKKEIIRQEIIEKIKEEIFKNPQASVDVYFENLSVRLSPENLKKITKEIIEQIKEEIRINPKASVDLYFENVPVDLSSKNLKKKKKEWMGSGSTSHQKDLASLINGNDGHIKTEDLGGNEIELLLPYEVSKIQNHLFVLEYNNDYGFLLSDAQEARIKNFKASGNDILGFIVNQEGFHHWIGYVAYKKRGQVILYRLNSIQNKQLGDTFETRLKSLLV